MTWLASPVQQKSLRLLSHYFAVLAVTMAVFSLLLAYSWHVELSVFLRWIVLLCQVALAACAYAGAYKPYPINTGLYLAGLLISTLLLGAFLHETGGHTNPLISLLLLPVAMSAAMLFWQSTVL